MMLVIFLSRTGAAKTVLCGWSFSVRERHVADPGHQHPTASRSQETTQQKTKNLHVAGRLGIRQAPHHLQDALHRN